MTVDGARFPDLSANHRRGIETALCLLDRMLCQFEQIAEGREQHAVLYAETNRLSATDREALRSEMHSIREVLRRLKEDLGLTGEVDDLARVIWGGTASLWEVLVETESRYLARYGPTPPGLAEYLDPLVETLIRHVCRIGDIAWRLLRDASRPATGSPEVDRDEGPAHDPPAAPAET